MTNPLESEMLPDIAPFWERDVTLAVVVENQLFMSHTKGGKVVILRDLAPRASIVLATWHGQYYSNIFTVSEQRWKKEKATLH